MSDGTQPSDERDALRRDLLEAEGVVAQLRALVASLEGRNEALQSALINHAHEIELLKRKLFGPRSERTGVEHNGQLLLGDVLADRAALQKKLDEARAAEEAAAASSDDEPKSKNRKPTGRRDLALSSLPQVVIDITDPELEAKGKLIDYDVSRQLARKPGGYYVLVKRTAKYEVVTPEGTTVIGVPSPATVLSRSILHTSLIAWIAVQKFTLGVPHYRLEQQLEAEGAPVARSVMSRNIEEIGNALGATIVHAMFEHARASCRVLSTDATGAAIQPGLRDGGPKRPCKKGHFFTVVADRDHVLYEFTSEHSSAFVARMFKGFKGFLQTDASSVYDVLDRGPPLLDGDAGLTLVGCWAHCRRYFFEAAICKYEIGVEGLKRIRSIYAIDETLKNLAPGERKRERERLLGPLFDDFFSWVAAARRPQQGRTLAVKALGYALNQEAELRRVLSDGRLALDNTRSERSLRKIVVGRKNWLFYGSDVHAEAAAALFSLLASCRLHTIEPVGYLDEVLRVLPLWPRDRYLELAPLRWAETRARLDVDELARPVGAVTVPPAI